MSPAASALPLLLLLLPAAARSESATKVAGSVVRSKEWVVRRGKAREEEFRGDVRYDAAGTKLSADWALYRQGPNDWHAKGNIYARRVFKEGDVVETRGKEAWHNQTTSIGRLEPAAGVLIPILHTPVQGDPDHAEGERLTWIGQSSGTLTGRARGWGPRGEFWSATAHYDRLPPVAKGLPPDESMTLTGDRPVLHSYQGGDDAAVKADKIVVFDSPRRAVFTGRALGWTLSPSTDTPKNGPIGARCGSGTASTGPGPVAGVAALLSPLGTGRAADEEKRFWDAETAAFAARACPWGPRVDFWADEADYAQQPERVLTLSGGRPVLHKIDGTQSSAVKADRIVAFETTRRVVATGKVKGWIVFEKERKSSDKKKTEDKKAKKHPEKTK
ncbi:MAG: hypothetical protein ACHQ49_09850 [Elusimicrobiota bacterium]